MNKEAIRLKFYELIDKVTYDDFKGYKKEHFDCFKEIKEYLIQHPNDDISKEILSIFSEYYKVRFTNLDFIKAVNMSNKFKFLKKQKIFEHLPIKNKNDIDLFTHVIPNHEYKGNILEYYKGCLWLLANYHRAIFNSIEYEMIIKFISENEEAIKSMPREYKTIDEEINLYKSALINKYSDDYINYKSNLAEYAADNCYYLDPCEIKNSYLEQKINNIAALYFFDCVKHLENARFVSKELSDKLGYDIYYTASDGEKKELLFAIKSTTDMDKKELYLTDVELKALVESLTISNTRYFVCLSRVAVNDNLQIQNTILEAKDMFTLVDVDSKEEYKINFNEDDKLYKAVPKDKIKTIKKDN